jgi:hypothetical protein
MSNHESMRKLWVVIPIALLVSAVFLGTYAQSVNAGLRTRTGFVHHNLDVPMATSGNNLYMVWPNNDTGHWNVFFAKSTDGGKTLKTMMISAPNKGHTIDLNTQISASGSNVYVTWWTNKSGTVMPVLRASNDNGDTFGKAITLNSTG